MGALGKEPVNGQTALTATFLCRVPPDTRQSLCRVPDRRHSAKNPLPEYPIADGSLPSATLGKAFAECIWAFAECPWHSAKSLLPVVFGLNYMHKMATTGSKRQHIPTNPKESGSAKNA